MPGKGGLDPGLLQSLLAAIEEAANGGGPGGLEKLAKSGRPAAIRRLAQALIKAMELNGAAAQCRGPMNEAGGKDPGKMREAANGAACSLAAALEARDPYTFSHAQRVGGMAGRLAAKSGLTPEQADEIRLAGLLHDLGKIDFPDELFGGGLTKIDAGMRRLIQRHPALGADLLTGLECLGSAVAYVLSHHEQPDGNGYPHGLRGEEIPLGARIVRVADVYDALAEDRPYRPGMGAKKALQAMRGMAGRPLDGGLVEALAEMLAAGQKNSQ